MLSNSKLIWKRVTMPYLDFSAKPIELAMSAHPHCEHQLDLHLPVAELQTLQAGLEDLLENQSRELRVDFPNKWTVFWKLREGETRLLLAHPEEHVWVATVAMTHEHCQAVVRAFKDAPADAHVMSRLGVTSRLSNLELKITGGS